MSEDSGAVMREFLSRVEGSNLGAVPRAAELILDRWREGGLLYAAGAGHSLAAVNETFYRAGGLAFVRPIHHPSLFPLNGAQPSTTAERRSGLAAEVLADYDLGARDVLVVFSNSGINYYPVELAGAAKDAGAAVIAVTSVEASMAAPPRAPRRLFELADEVLDTMVPPGDAAWPVADPVTMSLSSLANVFVWNQVLAEIWSLANRLELDVPLWRSANTGTGTDNDALFSAYAHRIPELG